MRNIYQMTDGEFFTVISRTVTIIAIGVLILTATLFLICPPASAYTATMGDEEITITWTDQDIRGGLEKIEIESDYIDVNPATQGMAIYKVWISTDPGESCDITLYQFDGSTITGYIHDNRSITGGDIDIGLGLDTLTTSYPPAFVFSEAYHIYTARNETTTGAAILIAGHSPPHSLYVFSPVADIDQVPIGRVVISGSDPIQAQIEIASPQAIYDLTEDRDNPDSDIDFLGAVINFAYDSWPIINAVIYLFGQVVANIVPIIVMFECLAAAVAFGKSRDIWKAAKKFYRMNKEFIGTLISFIRVIVEIFTRIIGVIVPW